MDAGDPREGECGVLSLVALLDGSEWVLASGSLLTVERAVALTSWARWADMQPTGWPRLLPEGFDLGPQFVVDPFPGVRLVRQVIERVDWPAVVAQLTAGECRTPTFRCSVRADGWTSRGFLGRGGITDAHQVVDGACRPVVGVAARLEAPEPPELKGTWELALPPHVEPGRELGEMARNRRLLRWASLVGKAARCSSGPSTTGSC
jgi:hypothetical protein